MSQAGGKDRLAYDTLQARGYPTLRQFSIFSPNNLGQLLGVMRTLERSPVQIRALTIVDSADCAILRLIVDQAERAESLLKQQGFAFCEMELLGIELPTGQFPLQSICTTLLRAEIDIHYCYPIALNMQGRSAMAFCVDDLDAAADQLQCEGFSLLSELELQD